jgi:hypothetical protein
MNILDYIRSILELLYFASGIVIAVAVVLSLKQIRIGLQQLKTTREIANTNAKREAIKLAAEQCNYYAERTVPLFTEFVSEYKRLGLKYMSTKPQFAIQNGEIVNTNFDTKLLDAEVPKIIIPLVNFLNSVEAFAIPFAAAVADENLGYQETAINFCQTVRVHMSGLFQMRRTNNGRFESTIRLYMLWNNRLVGHALAPIMETLEELVKSGQEQKINPLGTDN